MYEKSIFDCSIKISNCSIGDFPSSYTYYSYMLHWCKLTYDYNLMHAIVKLLCLFLKNIFFLTLNRAKRYSLDIASAFSF